MTTIRKNMRVYADASVVSGVFDHADKSKPFWNAVINGKIRIIVSDVLEQELQAAPERVRTFFAGLPETQIERVVSTNETDKLAAAYNVAGVVKTSHSNHGKHIALASVNHADSLVSWNIKQIVSTRKIQGYNSVNTLNHYPAINITTPYSLISGDENYDETS